MDAPPPENPCTAGLYLHIPFCLQKCAYCDFCSYADMAPLYDDYVAALRRQVQDQASRSDAPWGEMHFDTVFIGGGTPTVLPVAQIAPLLDTCRRHMEISANAEITIEANPGTVDETSLRALREAGINRLSLGVQSLHDDELALLGRIHDAAEAEAAYRAARRAGFDNVNLDLIYGLPDQSLAHWCETLARVVAMNPEHLSLYALSIEEGTPLAARIEAGQLPPPDDEIAAGMYEHAERLLADHGYVHYEISNWARDNGTRPPGEAPQWACRHNLIYWHNERYLGLGAGACSYDGRRRATNVWDPAEYGARIARAETTLVDAEETDRNLRMDETMMLGLRLVEGVTHRRFEVRFGVSLDAVYGGRIAALVADGLLVRDIRGVRLTPRGRLLGNRVFAEFLR